MTPRDRDLIAAVLEGADLASVAERLASDPAAVRHRLRAVLDELIGTRMALALSKSEPDDASCAD